MRLDRMMDGWGWVGGSFSLHLCYGSPFLPSLSVPWLGAHRFRLNYKSNQRLYVFTRWVGGFHHTAIISSRCHASVAPPCLPQLRASGAVTARAWSNEAIDRCDLVSSCLKVCITEAASRTHPTPSPAHRKTYQPRHTHLTYPCIYALGSS